MNNDNNNYNYNDNDSNYDNNGDNFSWKWNSINSEEELNRGALNVISNKPNKQIKVTKHKSKKVPSKKSWVWNWFAEINLPNGKKFRNDKT